MADRPTIPAAAWHDWHGEKWAVSTVAMFRKGMPVIEMPNDGISRWFGKSDRRATEADLDSVVKTPNFPTPDPLVHPNFAPAFAAAARVVVWGKMKPIRLFDAEGRLCGVVMPSHAGGDTVPLSTLCTYEVDRG